MDIRSGDLDVERVHEGQVYELELISLLLELEAKSQIVLVHNLNLVRVSNIYLLLKACTVSERGILINKQSIVYCVLQNLFHFWILNIGQSLPLPLS